MYEASDSLLNARQVQISGSALHLDQLSRSDLPVPIQIQSGIRLACRRFRRAKPRVVIFWCRALPSIRSLSQTPLSPREANSPPRSPPPAKDCAEIDLR